MKEREIENFVASVSCRSEALKGGDPWLALYQMCAAFHGGDRQRASAELKEFLRGDLQGLRLISEKLLLPAELESVYRQRGDLSEK